MSFQHPISVAITAQLSPPSSEPANSEARKNVVRPANAVLNHGHLNPGRHVSTKPFRTEVLASRIKELITGSLIAIDGTKMSYEGQTRYELAILIGLLDPEAAKVEVSIP